MYNKVKLKKVALDTARKAGQALQLFLGQKVLTINKKLVFIF